MKISHEITHTGLISDQHTVISTVQIKEVKNIDSNLVTSEKFLRIAKEHNEVMIKTTLYGDIRSDIIKALSLARMLKKGGKEVIKTLESAIDKIERKFND